MEVHRFTNTYGSKTQFAPMTTSCSTTQNSPTRVPAPITASGWIRAVDAIVAEGSIGTNPDLNPACDTGLVTVDELSRTLGIEFEGDGTTEIREAAPLE